MDDREALRQVVRAAEELREALDESDKAKVLGSDFESKFRALKDALAALPDPKSQDWGSVEEDWHQDAPGG